MSSQYDEQPEEEPTIVRDKRRVDPVTGQVRAEAASPGGAGGGPTPAPGDLAAGAGAAAANPATPEGDVAADQATQTALAERTADLQRLKAEFDNYRRRVERDRVAVAEQALGSVLTGLLPVLDDVGRAREHGELTGGFKSVAEGLEQTLSKLGLTAYGEPGDAFDPTIHEALMHQHSADVERPTCVQILQPGYRLGERVLRAARVAVAEPETPSAAGGEGRPRADEEAVGGAGPQGADQTPHPPEAPAEPTAE
jgi:molecular chaperone GrpE